MGLGSQSLFPAYVVIGGEAFLGRGKASLPSDSVFVYEAELSVGAAIHFHA